MTDEELIAELRGNGFGIMERAADRIEALVKERGRAWQEADAWAGKRGWAVRDKEAAEARAEAAEAKVANLHKVCSEYESKTGEEWRGRLAAEAKVAKLVEALRELHHAVCGETGFAACVRNHSGTAYPWPALDFADDKARAALAEIEGDQK